MIHPLPAIRPILAIVQHDKQRQPLLVPTVALAPTAIVLLHLSRECNCPELLAEFWRSASPGLAELVHITNQVEAIGPIAIAGSLPLEHQTLFS